MDEYSIRPGESMRDALEKGLRESNMIVFLVSPESVRRPNLFFEIGAAIGMGKPFVPVISKEVDLSLLPSSLRVRKYLVRGSPQATADELISETVESNRQS